MKLEYIERAIRANFCIDRESDKILAGDIKKGETVVGPAAMLIGVARQHGISKQDIMIYLSMETEEEYNNKLNYFITHTKDAIIRKINGEKQEDNIEKFFRKFEFVTNYLRLSHGQSLQLNEIFYVE